MKIFAKSQPMRPQQGNVNIQAVTMCLATSHLTLRGFFSAPTPMMAAVEQCDVETGMPVMEAMNRVITVEMDAATPC